MYVFLINEKTISVYSAKEKTFSAMQGIVKNNLEEFCQNDHETKVEFNYRVYISDVNYQVVGRTNSIINYVLQRT